ncbi:hypothetical protein HPP92_017797 [Vanilla planifolia]|uniref:Uncharacterized protein n=1 Tax=Vanilla planifolia TaxID=51239 RepID=A0A835QBK1_VANPL|nr:hypothetical protein HPP92_017797 [Vanilla planifolia]
MNSAELIRPLKDRSRSFSSFNEGDGIALICSSAKNASISSQDKARSTSPPTLPVGLPVARDSLASTSSSCPIPTSLSSSVE